MTLQFLFACPLPNGMHARPASALEEQARRFRSEIALVNERNGCRADLRSVLALIAANIRHHDPLRLEVTGPDESAAMMELSAYVRDQLQKADEALPVVEAVAGHVELPPALRDLGLISWPGTPVSFGIGVGRVVGVGALSMREDLLERRAADAQTERLAIERGLLVVTAGLEEERSNLSSGVTANLIQAHLAVARDPELRRDLLQRVDGSGLSAAQAIAATIAHFTELLQATGSRLLVERALDIQDVCHRLLREIYGTEATASEPRLTEASIVLADRLTPSQFLALDRKWLRGLALRQAGSTSHTVILARSFRIPTITGLTRVSGPDAVGREGVVDAELGLLAVELSEAARRYYATESRRLALRAERLLAFATRPGATRDGQRLEVGVNISTAEEAAPAFDAGAEGVGVFRTEMLFARRDPAPSEAEQLEQYRRVLEVAAGRPVVIRTLDAGGDKPIPCLHLPSEANPFLGRRGVRVYATHEQVFRTQVRALWRASTAGSLRLLIPMVTCLDEVRWVRRVVGEEKERLVGLPHGEELPIGIMLETPALAFSLDHLAQEADFFSIGTNDLLQYFFAAERGNPDLDALADPLQPSFLRFLKRIIDLSHARGKWIGICGEMASSRRYLPLLVGLGPDEISLSPPALGPIKADLDRLSASSCRDLLAAALECPTAREVADQLEMFDRRSVEPAMAEDLIVLDSESASKAEAIKELTDLFYVLGRTDHPRLVDQGIWQREAVCSTGLGHGIAIPHCLTPHIRASTVGLLRLKRRLDWGAVDGEPVGLVILLAIREAERDTHLRIFSRLARQLMHEDFRRFLWDEADRGVILRFMRERVEPDV